MSKSNARQIQNPKILKVSCFNQFKAKPVNDTNKISDCQLILDFGLINW
jgi:hypothetical protein